MPCGYWREHAKRILGCVQQLFLNHFGMEGDFTSHVPLSSILIEQSILNVNFIFLNMTSAAPDVLRMRHPSNLAFLGTRMSEAVGRVVLPQPTATFTTKTAVVHRLTAL
jgi:hypothetical protein